MDMDRMMALFALKDRLDAGDLDEAGYDAAAARLNEAMAAEGPAPEEDEGAADLTAEESPSDDAPHDEAGDEGKAMDDTGGDDLEATGGTAPAVRPHGYEMMSRAHKALSGARKAIEADMGALDNESVREHMGTHVKGLMAACKAMKVHGKKTYKDLDEFPDDYADEPALETKDLAGVDADDGAEFMETGALDGGMSGLDEGAGGAMLGERPEDEESFGEEEMSDEEADMLAKSLPTLERRLGLR